MKGRRKKFYLKKHKKKSNQTIPIHVYFNSKKRRTEIKSDIVYPLD